MTDQQPNPTKQLTKTYRSGILGFADKKFARDLPKMAAKGWRVTSQSGTTAFTGRVASITVVYSK
jgi:hypothetical protein